MRGSLPENVDPAGAQSRRAVFTNRTSFLLRRNCTAVIAHEKPRSGAAQRSLPNGRKRRKMTAPTGWFPYAGCSDAGVEYTVIWAPTPVAR